jgi:hypothetical protein
MFTTTTTTTTSKTTTTKTNVITTSGGDTDAQKGSSGGLNIIPIAAAAGGGIILILIIVIVVLVARRKRDASNAAPKTDRAVVAFENPMYEASKKPGDTAEEHAGHEGLYDEPAFSKPVAKENPIYDNDEFTQAQSALSQHANAQPVYGDAGLGGSYIEAEAVNAGQHDAHYLDASQPDGYLEADSVGISLTQNPTYGDAELTGGDGYLDVAPDNQ